MNFDEIFRELDNNEKCLITNTMVEMEHCTPINEIDIIYGIRYGLLDKDFSETDLISQASEKFIVQYDIQDSTFSVENTYKSMIKRNSRNSKLYPIIKELLEINEDIITTCYFSHLNATELFLSLSPRNQSAILYLMKNLDTDFSITFISGNTGVQEQSF